MPKNIDFFRATQKTLAPQGSFADTRMGKSNTYTAAKAAPTILFQGATQRIVFDRAQATITNSNTGAVTYDAGTGRATATAVGTATITATYRGVNDTITIVAQEAAAG